MVCRREFKMVSDFIGAVGVLLTGVVHPLPDIKEKKGLSVSTPAFGLEDCSARFFFLLSYLPLEIVRTPVELAGLIQISPDG